MLSLVYRKKKVPEYTLILKEDSGVFLLRAVRTPYLLHNQKDESIKEDAVAYGGCSREHPKVCVNLQTGVR